MINCMHCGLCLSACPTYRVNSQEPLSPRGRLALASALGEARLPPNSKLSYYINSCLDCLACLAVCPSQVEVTEHLSQAKAKLRESQPMPLPLRLGLHQLLFHHSRLKALGYLFKPLRPRFPTLLRAKERKYRVGFFLGCLQNLLFPQVSQASLRVLQENGCEIVIPPDIKCCGKPFAAYGEGEKARELAMSNMRAFGDVEVIITDCATCGSFLKGYPQLLKGSAVAATAQVWASRVRDISQFLMDIGVKEPQREMKKRVTYHAPCHLERGQGVREAPRQMLRLIPGLELVEMDEADACCGGAGGYFLYYPQLSQGILERKMGHVAQTQAQILATGCPGCRLQLSRGLKQAQLPIKLLHPIQLLHQAYIGT